MNKTITLRQVNRFRNTVDKVLSRSNDLVMALNELSVQASEIYGEELVATICNGEEIEFRVNGDADSIIPLPDIFEKL